MKKYEATYDEILTRVEKARITTDRHNIVKVVAVSKSVEPSEVVDYYNIGQRAFGENRVQELSRKIETTSSLPLEWHFIGRLQKNKINQLLALNPALIHSCDSKELAVEIDKRTTQKVDILLQINSANEQSKAGVSLSEAVEEYMYIKENCKNLNLKGVMSIGAFSEDVHVVQKSFEATHKIYEQLKPHSATICSMGMSGDFELAIKCGSNMLRLGSILFK